MSIQVKPNEKYVNECGKETNSPGRFKLFSPQRQSAKLSSCIPKKILQMYSIKLAYQQGNKSLDLLAKVILKRGVEILNKQKPI